MQRRSFLASLVGLFCFPWRRKPHVVMSDGLAWSRQLSYDEIRHLASPRMVIDHNHPLAKGLIGGYCKGHEWNAEWE